MIKKSLFTLLFMIFLSFVFLGNNVNATECNADGFYHLLYSAKSKEIKVTRFGMGIEDVFVYSSLNFEKKKELSLDMDVGPFLAYYKNSGYKFSSVYDSEKYKKIVDEFRKDTVNLQLIDLKKLDMKFTSEIVKNFDLNITKRDVDYYKDTKYETISYEVKRKGNLLDAGNLYESCNGENCNSMMEEIPQQRDLKIEYGKSKTTIKNISNCNNQSEYNIRGYSYPGEKFIVFVITTMGNCYRGDRTETIGFMKLDKSLSENIFMKGDVKWWYIPGKYKQGKEINSMLGTGCDCINKGCETSCIDRRVETCWMLYKSQGGKLLNFDDFEYSQVLFYNNVGYQLYKQKAYENAINYRQFASNKNIYPLTTYNLAAVYAKMGNTKSAIVTLKKLLNSSKARWVYIPKIKSDKDFDKIRGDVEFKKLMSGWKKL